MAMMKQPFRINVVLVACLIGSTVYSVRNDDANPTIPRPIQRQLPISLETRWSLEGCLTRLWGRDRFARSTLSYLCAGAAGGPNVNIVFI
jgi:hypothetical protein